MNTGSWMPNNHTWYACKVHPLTPTCLIRASQRTITSPMKITEVLSQWTIQTTGCTSMSRDDNDDNDISVHLIRAIDVVHVNAETKEWKLFIKCVYYTHRRRLKLRQRRDRNVYIIRLPDRCRKALSFTHELYLFSFFINTLRSTPGQWMAIKCIPEVRA